MATAAKDDDLYSFDVPETTRNANGPTMYKIILQVTPKDITKNGFQIVHWKRYSDIRKFYEILHRYHLAIFRPEKFPDFPEKSRFMERYNQTVIEERRVATKEFLNFALQRLYLRTHDAYVKFFEKGERIIQADVNVETLKPERIIPNSNEEPVLPTVEPTAVEQSNDLLLTLDDEEKVERVTENCAKLLDELNELQLDQDEELQLEKQEFDALEEEINRAASNKRFVLITTDDKNPFFPPENTISMFSSFKRHINFKDLFPSRWSFVIFLSYIGLFINQGLLVTGSKTKSHTYNYNTIVVVLFTEFVKLLSATVIYRQTHSFGQMRREIFDNLTVLLLYFIPSALYCLYNNLAFRNLSSYDPTTYFLLLQFRVVVTGIIFQILFKKRLTRLQWLSLILLTFGCIIKQFEHSSHSKPSSDSSQTDSVGVSPMLNIHLIWILVQVFCSCFAGVYNEYLLKDERTAQVDVMLQNIFMYFDSILCNFIFLVFADYQQTNLSAIEKIYQTVQMMFDGKEILIILIILNNAAVGIVTSLFLKFMDVILKSFASALELMFTSLLAWLFFGIPVSIYTFFAIFIVSFAVYLYSLNPVRNPPKIADPNLLDTNDLNSKSASEQGKRLIV